MKKLLILLSLLGLPALALAQERPVAASTLQTTDTSTASVKVGCAIGSSTCTGGLMAGPLAVGPISIGSGYVEIQSFVPAAQTNRLVNNSGTLQWNGSALAIGGSISGVLNTIPVFTGTSSIGNSIMTQSGGNTITVATILNATTLGGTLSTAAQPNVTTMAGLTSAAALATVGTIGTGTWQGTKIGLAYGGTNADLSGTGGTSQFLRQNTLGGAVTVVRPVVADLSDGADVARLSASNTFSTTSTGLFAQFFRNLSNGALATTELRVGNDIDAALTRLVSYPSTAATSGLAGASITALVGNGSMNIGVTGSGQIGLYTANTQRWGINAAGDFTVGSSSRIFASVGAPVLSGGGTSAAVATGCTDSSCTVYTGSTASTQFVLSFSAANKFTNVPTCVGSPDATGMNLTVGVTGNAVTVNYSSTIGAHVAIHCFNGS